MSYNSLNLIDGDVLTSSHIRHIEGGLRDIESNINTMKTSLINILSDKGIVMPASASFEELYQKVTYLQAPQSPNYEYSEEVEDITDVESGTIKIVFDDSNSGQVAFRIAATTGITVDWGDGHTETLTTSPTSWNEFSHTYTVGTGEYLNGTNTQFIVEIEPLVENGITGFRRSDVVGKRNAMLAYASKDIYYTYISSDMFGSCAKLEYIYIDGGSYGVAGTQFSMNSFCGDCNKLKTVYIPNIVWNSVTGMSSAFSNCFVLENLNLGSSWDSINCTTFYYAFSYCRALTSIPSFKTNSSTSMTFCFQYCNHLETINGSWDLAACNNFSSVFLECRSLTSLPILNNMYNITTMSNCFSNCTALVNFNEDQEDFDTESCLDFTTCFNGCTLLEEIPAFDFSSATSIRQMFYNCAALYIMQSVINAPNIIGTACAYTDNGVRDGLDCLFYNCIALTTAPTIVAPQALNAYQLFYGCTSLVNVPDINLPSVTRAHEMFYNCTSLINAPHHINLPKAQNIRTMFYGCVALRNGPEYANGDSLSCPEAIYAYDLFNGCTSLVNAPKNIVLNKATHIYSMFYGCANIVSAPLTIVAPLAQQVYYLFYACTKMTTPPASLSFPEALIAHSLFYNCSSLLVCPELSLPKATNLDNMFYNCTALTSTIPYEFPSATTAQSFYRGCNSLVTIALVQFGAVCNINYFHYEGSSKLATAYFPEAVNSGRPFWTTSTYSPATGNILTKYSNAVDSSGSNANINDIFNYTYIEEIQLKNFGGSLSMNNKAYLTSVRFITPSNTMGDISLYGNQLNAAALNQLFTDLPTVSTPRTINVRNNPGSSTCNTSIATAKNWVVTIV